MTGSANQILACLAARRFSCTSEDELQLAIAEVFDAAGIAHEREVYLSSVDRPDFLIGDIAVEVKTKGSRAEVIRQLYRYASHSRVAAIVLATTRAQHRMPERISGKPVSVAYLGRL